MIICLHISAPCTCLVLTQVRYPGTRITDGCELLFWELNVGLLKDRHSVPRTVHGACHESVSLLPAPTLTSRCDLVCNPCAVWEGEERRIAETC